LSYVCDAGVLTSTGLLVKVKTNILTSLQEKCASTRTIEVIGAGLAQAV
jgi:hypothetical protein